MVFHEFHGEIAQEAIDRANKIEAAWDQRRTAIRAWLPRANAALAAVDKLARGKAALAAAETAESSQLDKESYSSSDSSSDSLSDSSFDLLDALDMNNLELMIRAIKSGADVNLQWNFGTTPLICLCKSEDLPNIEMIDLLLTNNADPNLQDEDGYTPLHWAVSKGYLKVVKRLLESEDICVNITSIGRENALHFLLQENDSYVELNEESDEESDEESNEKSNEEIIIKLLIEKGININETENDGKTPLHLAAEQNNGKAVGILLRAGANENIKTYTYNPTGNTAYKLAENNKNRIELDRKNCLVERADLRAVFGVSEDSVRITHVKPNLVRVVITVGEEERPLEIPRDILELDHYHNLWFYEPFALMAFDKFHKEQSQDKEKAQKAINKAYTHYLAKEAKSENSILNSLPDDLEKRISKMF